MALSFGERHVDDFLDSLTHEAFQEWEALFSLHPQGWEAINAAVARVAWAAFQSQSTKPVKESQFLMRIVSPPTAEQAEALRRARYEAMTIRSELQTAMASHG